MLGSKVFKGSCRINLRSNCSGIPNLVRKTPHQSETHCWSQMTYRVIRGQPVVKMLRNTLWSPNLARRTPNQNETQCWVKGHKEVRLLRNALWPSNLVTITPDQHDTNYWSQRSHKGYTGEPEVNLQKLKSVDIKFYQMNY